MEIPRLQAPIILIHGLFGFDRLRMGSWVLANYFAGIPEALEATGNRVLRARLSPTAGVADRASQLKDQLDKAFPDEPVHLIGHSMGGLDARYLISRLGMADRVLSLTTLGTPHRGSSFADWGVRRLRVVVEPLLKFLGMPYQAFFDLTVAACCSFNDQTPDHPGVRYFSVAGRFEPDWTSPEWHLPASVLKRQEGANDGVVSVASATWGESVEVWDADHLGLVNWKHPLGKSSDRLPQYAKLLARLAAEGF
jgi:triacylglycerol lipase